MGTKLTAGQAKNIRQKLAEIRRQLSLKRGYPHDFGMLDDSLRLLIEGNFWGVSHTPFGPKEKKSETKILTSIEIGRENFGTIGPTSAKKTSECFMSRRVFLSRDGRLDRFLPTKQSGAWKGEILCDEVSLRAATVVEMIAETLGTKKTSRIVSRTLVKKGLFWTLPDIESMVDLWSNLNSGIMSLHKGHSNLFPVINRDRSSVSVVDLQAVGTQWSVFLRSFRDRNRFVVGSRIFTRHYKSNFFLD